MVAPPIHGAGEECPVVERHVGHLRKAVEKFPMHFQYTKFMREVNVADQLKGKKSCQVCTHKWWDKHFFPLGHHCGPHVKTSFSPVFNFKNKNLESQMSSTPFGKGFSITPPPISQLHFSFQSLWNIFSHVHVKSSSQSMLWMFYMVPNILPVLLWTPHPHWRVLEGGSPSNFLLKVIFFICKF